VIITASYEGQPPDNAGHFIEWLGTMKAETQPLKDVSYAVFGCGNREWTQTFHRVPKLVDSKLAELGAERLAELGLADVSTGQVFTDFETWEDNVFWDALRTRYNAKPNEKKDTLGVKVSITTPRATALHQEVKKGVVVRAETLAKDGESKELKKHLEIRLPEGISYSSGDYLAVLPINPRESVQRVMRRYQLPWDAQLEISADTQTTLPTNTPLAAFDVLSSYLELSQPATKRVSATVFLPAKNTDQGTSPCLF
jgi:cytochrome P450/NADPH-cytochrome P450 reductase